ncbi:RING finger protein 214 [Spea bombifrons]|uniref:RING finger protein 214 n=1 Tax=Spea bombifrons TaxID=233779 RepID=UPI00234B84D2|nr:RING finger protein 214 [Spea bombifrons]
MSGQQSEDEGDSAHQPFPDTREGQKSPACPGSLSRCVAVQTECGKQDAETITDIDAEEVLKELISHREQLKDNYQVVLDRQIQAEKQLQVQLKQLKQKKEEEIQRHQDALKAIQDVAVKREETRKRTEKDKKEHCQKEQDLNSELEKMQSKSERLQQEREELEKKIVSLLAEQTKEKEEWESELASLKKQEDKITQSVQEENDRAVRAEVLSLESRRDLLLISLEDAENEADVTLSCLRVATPTLEWIQLKQKWEARLAGIQQIKANLREQFDSQIQQVRNGCKLTSLPSIMAPSLPPPPSDTNLMLQRIALSPLQMPHVAAPFQPSVPYTLPKQSQLPSALPCQPSPPLPHIPGPFSSATPAVPRAASTTPFQTTTNDHSAVPPAADKLSKILEKLQARFPQCSKAQLTGVMQQIKMARGTLSGLTVEELCKLVANRLVETQDLATNVTLPPRNGRSGFHTPQGTASFGPSSPSAYLGQPLQLSAPCKLCLICQQIVHPTDLKPMSCNHVMHQKCISFWASTNQNASCPFCPRDKP